MGHLGGGQTYVSHEELPSIRESEQKIAEKAQEALGYLNRTHNEDLAEMLGLPEKGEN